MNIKDFKDLDHDWDAEKRRRLSYKRQKAWRDSLRTNRLEVALMVAIVVGFFAFMILWNMTQPLAERAAYIEGYYGVDHATAMAMAESEVR